MRALLIAAGGGVGDAFMASIVARALREGYATVDVLALPSHRSILQGNPDIAAVLDEADPETLRTARYDAAVCTWATLENALLPLQAGIPIRVGQSRRLYSFLFTERIRVRSELGDRETHWTQILLDYARALGCETEDTQPRVALAEADRAEADRILAQAGVDGGGPFAILHPTRGIANPQRWPAEPFARLARALVERYALPLFVTGSPQDRPFVERLFAHETEPTAIDLAGGTSLRSFTALAERARFVVAMDSGPMHLAASTGTPTVGIFALRSDEPRRWAPLGPRTAVVRGTYPCPPNHRKETCPNFACVSALEFAPIFEAVDRLTR